MRSILKWRSIVLFIALRYIYSNTINRFGQYIYWISSIAVMLGSIALIILMSVMNGFERELKQNLLYFIPHALITTAKGYVCFKYVPSVILNKLLNNIIYIKPLVMSDVILQSPEKISSGVMLGVQPNHFEPLANFCANNNFNQLVMGRYNIIIGSALAQILKVGINDQIRLIIPSINQNTPIGYIPSQRLFTISDIYTTLSEVDTYQVLVHEYDAAALMHYPLRCFTGWRIWLNDPCALDKLHSLKLPEGWIWEDWSKSKRSLLRAVKMEKNIMFLLISLIIIAAGFNIISFTVLFIMEKQKEIAILRTYGFLRIKIMLLFMIHGMSSGVLGVVFGTGLGVLLSKHLNQILLILKICPRVVYFPVEVQYLQIFNIIFMILLFILLITIYPSWYAASVCPAKVLGHG